MQNVGPGSASASLARSANLNVVDAGSNASGHDFGTAPDVVALEGRSVGKIERAGGLGVTRGGDCEGADRRWQFQAEDVNVPGSLDEPLRRGREPDIGRCCPARLRDRPACLKTTRRPPTGSGR